MTNAESVGADRAAGEAAVLRGGMGQYVPGVPFPFSSCTSPEDVSGFRAWGSGVYPRPFQSPLMLQLRPACEMPGTNANAAAPLIATAAAVMMSARRTIKPPSARK